jgi:ABC-type dipeptide/oligopeptide/nickel transport system permease subunit
VRPLALLLSLALIAPARAHGEELVFAAPTSSPLTYAPVRWCWVGPTSTTLLFTPVAGCIGATSTPGFWFSDQKVVRIDGRIRYLEDKAGKDCFDNTVAAEKSFLASPAAVLLGVGASLLLGGLAGFYAAKKLNP